MRLDYADKEHAYWLTPDGVDKRRCKGMSRIAKIPDDTYALEKWSDRMVALGMALRPELIEQAAAHHDNKAKLEEIADKAKDAAKAFDRQQSGLAAHAIVEKSDQGRPVISTEFSDAVVAGWNEALNREGLEPCVGLTERIVIWPELFICGRFDCIRRRRRDGMLVMVDLKTGEKADRYPHAHSVQLGGMANAPLMAGPLSKGLEGWTEDFEPLPEPLDREVGYVVHMPEPGKAEVLRVNIAAGYAIFRDHIVAPGGILDWRARQDLVLPKSIADAELEILLLRSLPRFQWARDRRDWIKAQGFAESLAEVWSIHCPEIPTFPKGGPRTEAELSSVIAALDLVEMECEVPFGPPDPDPPKAGPTPAERNREDRRQTRRSVNA